MRINHVDSRVSFIALMFLLFTILPYSLSAQTNGSIVKGSVHNLNNEPLSGVSVIIRNTTTNFTSGTGTYSAGVFTYRRVTSGGPYVFSFSIVGYEDQTFSEYQIKEGITLSLMVQ